MLAEIPEDAYLPEFPLKNPQDNSSEIGIPIHSGLGPAGAPPFITPIPISGAPEGPSGMPTSGESLDTDASSFVPCHEVSCARIYFGEIDMS